MTNDTRAHKLKISENNILMMQHEIAEFVGFQTVCRCGPLVLTFTFYLNSAQHTVTYSNSRNGVL